MTTRLGRGFASWRPRSVEEYGHVIAPPAGDRLIAVIYAYLDASKTETREGVTVVAGYLAPLEEWKRLEKEWVQALALWGIPRFHLTELEGFIGREKAKDCVPYFVVNLIKPSDLVGIAACMLDENWDKRVYVSREVSFQPDKYRQCLEMALKAILTAVEKFYPGQEVSVLCDRDADPKVIAAVFDEMQEKNPALSSLTVSRCGQMRPLEAADLIAGLIRRRVLKAYDEKRAIFLPDLYPELSNWAGLPVGQKGAVIRVGSVVRAGPDRIVFGGLLWIITYRVAESVNASASSSPEQSS